MVEVATTKQTPFGVAFWVGVENKLMDKQIKITFEDKKEIFLIKKSLMYVFHRIESHKKNIGISQELLEKLLEEFEEIV